MCEICQPWRGARANESLTSSLVFHACGLLVVGCWFYVSFLLAIVALVATPQPSAVVSTRSFSKLSSDKPVTDKDVSAAAAALAAAAAKGGGLLSANPFAGHHGHHQSIRMKPAGDAPVAPLSSFTKKEGDNEESGAQKSSGAIGVLSRPMSRHNQLTPLQRPDSKEDVTAGDVESGHAASPAPPGTPEPSPSPTKSATASLLGALSGAAAAKKKPASASTQSKSTPPSKKKRGPNPMFRAVNRRSANPDVEAKRRKARAQLQVGTLMKVHSAKSILLRRLRARQAARGVTPGGGSKTAAAASAFGGSGLLGKLAAKAEEKKPEPEEEEAESLQDKIVGVASIPYVYLFKISVPDCREKKWEKWYMVTFSMSIFWIGVLSFLMVRRAFICPQFRCAPRHRDACALAGVRLQLRLRLRLRLHHTMTRPSHVECECYLCRRCLSLQVDFAARAGCVMKVPGIVMGLVVIAAGTSVPDALSSILVAKNGQGDMAVANVLGSNVFNIFLGLGLPWFLKSLVSDMDPIILPSDEVRCGVCACHACRHIPTPFPPNGLRWLAPEHHHSRHHLVGLRGHLCCCDCRQQMATDETTWIRVHRRACFLRGMESLDDVGQPCHQHLKPRPCRVPFVFYSVVFSPCFELVGFRFIRGARCRCWFDCSIGLAVGLRSCTRT